MMDKCEVHGCGKMSEFGVVYGGKRGCPDCWLKHCDPNDPLDFKKPETWKGPPAVFTRRAAAAVAAEPAASLF